MWYGARLSYFMEPTGTYSPKYATSYVVRIAAASSLEGLANAPEAVLGVRSTALVYGPNERLDRLAGVPLQDCAMVNDPALFAQGTTLYLIASCLAFSGEREDFTRTTQRVFATRPLGPPAEWTWRHVGVLATHEVAVELGDDTIVQPVISRAADGTLLYITAIAHDEPDGVTGVTGDGCRALELSSLDPPVLRRDAAGRLVIRAAIHGTGVASCAHDPWSASGMLAHDKGVPNGPWILRRTWLRP